MVAMLADGRFLFKTGLVHNGILKWIIKQIVYKVMKQRQEYCEAPVQVSSGPYHAEWPALVCISG